MSLRSRLRNLIARQRGNAVLFSLIIMTSAMIISLGMTSLVVGEVRSVSLVLPSEHAYYKAESYAEQALWQKKDDPSYEFKPATNSQGTVSPPVGQQLPANFLCTAQPCFLTAPTDQATLLKDFYATTSPNQEDVDFPADVSRQYEVTTTGANNQQGTLTISNIEEQNPEYRGMEVTIIAYPAAGTLTPRFPVEEDNPATGTVEGANTPVFVDKVFVPKFTYGGCDTRPKADECTITLSPTQQNPIGESYPALDASNVYRLRIKAFGGSANADVSVTSGGNTLDLQSPDFTVRSVAEDATSRRGIQVQAPNTEQLASIFDFVIFSDLDLNKTGAKVPPKSIVANVYRDTDGDCTQDPGETGVSNQLVTASAGGVDRVATTNDDGTASLIGLQKDTDYTVSTSLPAGYVACSSPGNDQTVRFNNDSTEVRQVTFLLRQAAGPTPTPTPSAGPTSTTAGPKQCTTAQNDFSSGILAWAFVNNACTQNDNGASVTPIFGLTSVLLKTTGYGFSIPGNATITGVTVEVRSRVTGGAAIDDRIQLVKNGSNVGSNQAHNAALPSGSYQYLGWGGSTNMWGTTWTPAEINSGSFGVVFGVKKGDNNFINIPTVSVDAVRINVTYTTP